MRLSTNRPGSTVRLPGRTKPARTWSVRAGTTVRMPFAVEHLPGTADAERAHALQLGVEAFGERHVVERHDDVLAARDVDSQRGELRQAIVETSCRARREQPDLRGSAARWPPGGSRCPSGASTEPRADGCAAGRYERSSAVRRRAQHARPGQR